MSPTPRPDRISKDYEKEYPSIEIEGRRTVRKSPSKEKRNKSHVDNVKLETEVFNQLKDQGQLCVIKSFILLMLFIVQWILTQSQEYMFYVHWKIGYTFVGNIAYSFN